MMKNLFLFVLITLLSFSFLAGEKIDYFRKAFNGIKDIKTADAFINTEIDETKNSNVTAIYAYKGVCVMMKAQYVYNPIKKYSYFNEGKKILALSIKANKNLENVYLRLIVQLNCPSFLGYNKEIKTDTKFIKDNLESSNVPDETKKYILKNLVATGESNSLKPLAKKYGIK